MLRYPMRLLWLDGDPYLMIEDDDLPNDELHELPLVCLLSDKPDETLKYIGKPPDTYTPKWIKDWRAQGRPLLGPDDLT
jgi:hypothetical protein